MRQGSLNNFLDFGDLTLFLALILPYQIFLTVGRICTILIDFNSGDIWYGKFFTVIVTKKQKKTQPKTKKVVKKKCISVGL